MKIKSKQLRIGKRAERKERNRKALDSAKKKTAAFCGIGGNYSTLELVIIAAAKLGLTVNGSIHPNEQILKICKLIDKACGEPKLRCKTKKDFYSSRAWKILRYQAFERYGNKCACCGAKPEDGLIMHVDHIKPRSKHPELSLDIENLQILCEDCNVGKINQWETNWRP